MPDDFQKRTRPSAIEFRKIEELTSTGNLGVIWEEFGRKLEEIWRKFEENLRTFELRTLPPLSVVPWRGGEA